jgi:hypothetical protein
MPKHVARCLGLLCILVVIAGCGGSPDVTSVASSSATRTPTSTPTSSTPSPTSPAVTTPPVPDRQPHTLVLRAEEVGSGDITITKFKYTLDGKVEQEGRADLPWRKSLSVPADGLPHSYTLEVEYTGAGRFKLFAIFDGKVVAQTDGQGSGSNVEGGGAIGGTVRG